MNNSNLSRRLICLSIGLLAAWQSPAWSADDLASAQELYQKKDYRQAAQIFHRLAQKPDGARATYFLGLCYHNLGARENAVKVFTHIQKRWPDSKEARLAQAYLTNQESLNDAAPTKATKTTKTAKKPVHPLFKPITEAEWKLLPEKSRIPFQREDGHLKVKAKVNGQYCKMVFDTGASSCTISLTDFPNVIPKEVLAKSTPVPMMRPYGMTVGYMCDAEISLHDITRKVKVVATSESGVSLIGQNFFKEYSYSIDNFYIRLTKEPYSVPDTETSKSTTIAANSTSPSKNQKSIDRWSLPFKTQGNVMLVDIVVNGHNTKACFDTGCAVDGIVVPPSLLSPLGIKVKNRMQGTADRVIVGPINKSYVNTYVAAGLQFILIGPKIFDRPYTVDQKAGCIRFDY